MNQIILWRLEESSQMELHLKRVVTEWLKEEETLYLPRVKFIKVFCWTWCFLFFLGFLRFMQDNNRPPSATEEVSQGMLMRQVAISNNDNFLFLRSTEHFSCFFRVTSTRRKVLGNEKYVANPSRRRVFPTSPELSLSRCLTACFFCGLARRRALLSRAQWIYTRRNSTAKATYFADSFSFFFLSFSCMWERVEIWSTRILSYRKWEIYYLLRLHVINY